jgi:hypothetical protein
MRQPPSGGGVGRGQGVGVGERLLGLMCEEGRKQGAHAFYARGFTRGRQHASASVEYVKRHVEHAKRQNMTLHALLLKEGGFLIILTLDLIGCGKRKPILLLGVARSRSASTMLTAFVLNKTSSSVLNKTSSFSSLIVRAFAHSLSHVSLSISRARSLSFFLSQCNMYPPPPSVWAQYISDRT